ncbi:MAG: hypothetical protein H7331_08785 [Bacteroidia bacterium]|nr:hypothetical protein [Bacteroidia bacterium]
MKLLLLLVNLLITTLFFSCTKIKVNNFIPITNIDSKVFYTDMEHVIMNGIEAPTTKQVKGGKFEFKFDVENNSGEELYYKIYFQNEDYKFIEDEELSNENFYGSWGDDDNVGFKKIPTNTTSITDYFKIAGNPRNEHKYYGVAMKNYNLSTEQITNTINSIKGNEPFYASIIKKAETKNRSVEEQLTLDAIFCLCMDRDIGAVNHKWKRNPRMGKYSTLLVVCTKKQLDNIPDYIKDISQTHHNKYVNPYQYFLFGEGKNVVTALNINTITLKSKLDLSKGIFINNANQQTEPKLDYLTNDCNSTQQKYEEAHVEQFFHYEDKDFKLNTIPVIADVLANEYTLDDYHKAEKMYKEAAMVKDYIRSSNCPCKTVSLNKTENYIQLLNPASTDIKTAKKENVGIKTRVGYTYGKFTAKIKFPPLINKTNVWTGVTNAFWMLFQDTQEWNNRRESTTGYLNKGDAYVPNTPRTPSTYYSEIDFEIVKATQHWPLDYYKDKTMQPEDAQHNENIMVGLTNWDLCNKDPKNYFHGLGTTEHNNNSYEAFRWEDYYKALTIRQPYSNREMFNRDYYYYQIEWTPTAIIWRVGPEKNKLIELGYMDADVTSIPNNQMLMNVTQEYHLSKWWPPIPFKQEFTPFLKNDLVGKIYEFEIE